MRAMIRKISVAIALAAALAFPAAASAHVELTPADAPAGKPVNLKLEVGHGCDGASTIGLVVQIPAGASEVTATAIPGWKATTTPKELKWKGGPLPDHDLQEFPLRATLSGKKGDVVEFKTIQKCEGGAETAWIQAPEAGGSESEHPTPAVTLASTGKVPVDTADPEVQQEADEDANSGQPTATDATSEETSSDDDGGGDGKTLLLIIVVGLAIGTVAGIVVRGRRK